MATQVITMDLLGRGAHTDPRHGCNVLELASVLAGERWSTSPLSVHPALATVAQTVNDLLTDDRKRLLVPLAPWLPGTNSADPRIWPAVASACIRAALASVSGPDQPRILAELNRAREWFVRASSASGGRREQRTRRRDRQWVMDVSRSALLQMAASADPEAADAALCQALVECINQCRRLAGEEAVDPLLPLADCPQRLQVRPRTVWSPGCDWMEQGYQPITDLLPARAPATPRPKAPDQRSAATERARQAVRDSHRIRGRPGQGDQLRHGHIRALKSASAANSVMPEQSWQRSGSAPTCIPRNSRAPEVAGWHVRRSGPGGMSINFRDTGYL